MGVFFQGRSVPLLYNKKYNTTLGNSRDIIQFLRGKFITLDAHDDNFQNEEINGFFKRTKISLDFEKKFQKLGLNCQRIIYHNLLQNDLIAFISNLHAKCQIK